MCTLYLPSLLLVIGWNKVYIQQNLKCQPNIKRLSCSCRKTTKVVDNENLGIYTNTGSDTQVLQSSESTNTPTSEKPLHNPYKSKKWYLSMHRLARSLTNQSCGPLLIWNGTLFSKMAPWCGQK